MPSLDALEGDAFVAPPLVTIVILCTFDPKLLNAAVVPLIVA